MIAQSLHDALDNSQSAPNLTGSEPLNELINTLGSLMIKSVKEPYKQISCNVVVSYLGDNPIDKEKKCEETSVSFVLKYTPIDSDKEKSFLIRNLNKLLSGLRRHLENESYQNMLNKEKSEDEAKRKSHIRSFSFVVSPDKTFRIENIKYYEN